MTRWELRAYVVLWAAKLMRIPLRELRDSYSYNPLVRAEVDAAFRNATVYRKGKKVSKAPPTNADTGDGK